MRCDYAFKNPFFAPHAYSKNVSIIVEIFLVAHYTTFVSLR